MRKQAIQILEWCIRTYGSSIFYNKLPKIVIKQMIMSDFYGVFDENKVIIEIHKCRIKSIEDLVDTIIHEYIHYMQPPGIYEVIEFYNSGSYVKNPLEQWSVKIAKRDTPKCIKDLKL